ncbi:protein ALP1-like [Zingiber officinale]|nr:protein ALP1-like [Zingiber officinale]XP_042455810.1 protein ALP1-like [Zingiber officinale]
MCGKGTRLNGENLKLPGGSEVQEYVIGDTGFPLLRRLLTPYRGKDLSHAEVEFNSRLTANGILAQRAFARLKDMWKIIHGEMWRPGRHRLLRIILVCCLLHNIAIDMEDEVINTMPSVAHEHDANYKQQFCDVTDDKGTTLRDRLCEYLSGGLGLPP